MKKIIYAILFIILILMIIMIIYPTYGIEFIAKREAISNTTLVTKNNDDCRIKNLRALHDESQGTGKIIFLKIFTNKYKSDFHLVVCDKNNKIIDKNNIVKETTCNIDKLSLNNYAYYKKMGELSILNNSIVNKKHYNENLDFSDKYFTLPIQGEKYSKVFLNSLEKK